MLKIILLCLVVFFSVYLFGGELVPLRQYDKLEQRVTMIPDHYLFEVVGELLALGFFDDNDKVFFNNFHNHLSTAEQYHIANILLRGKDDERINNIMIHCYNTMQFRIGGKLFDDEFDKKMHVVWQKFLKSLEENPNKLDEFYDYVCRVVKACKNDMPENEQLYIANMLRFASLKKMQYNSDEEQKKSIVQFVVNTINKFTSNNAKTLLTFSFSRYMTEEQFAGLNTTEYALILSIPLVLNCGRFLDFSKIYYNLMQNLKDYSFAEDTIEDFRTYVPFREWKSPQEVTDFIYKNRECIKFDNENRRYIMK